MAVQVPELNRFQETNDPSVGRVNVKVPDFQQAVQPQQKAFSNLVESGAETFAQQIKLRAETEATSVGNEYSNYLENRLAGPEGAKRQAGDPVPVYRKLDEDEDIKAREFRDKYKDASSETKAAVEMEIQKTKARFYDRKTSAFGAQNQAYQTGVTNDRAKLLQSKMMDDTAHLDINDETTLSMLNNTMDEMYDNRVRSGLQNGTAEEIKNEQGQVTGYKLAPSMQLQIAKDRSDGLYTAINNLSAAGDVEGAKYIKEKYGQFLLPDQKVKVEEKTKKAEIENSAQVEFSKVRGLPPNQAFDKLDKIKDPEVRKKAIANLDTYKRQMDNLQTRSSKQVYQAVANQVLNRQNSEAPFTDVNQMLQDPVIKRQWDAIRDPKQKEAIERMIEKPKISNVDKKRDAYEALSNGDFRGMSFDDFNLMVSGLNSKDASMFERQWKMFNNNTPAQELNQVKFMQSDLVKQLDKMNYVKKNDFGKYVGKMADRITQAQDDLTMALDKVGPLSAQEQKKFVQQFATSIVSGDVFNKDAALPTKRFQGSLKPMTKEDVVAQNAPLSEAAKTDMQKASRDFYKAHNNTWPKNVNELMNWMKTQKGK